MAKWMRIAALILNLLPVLCAQTVDVYAWPERAERSRLYDAMHYQLKYAFDMLAHTYWGENTITLTALQDELQTIALDAAEFKVTAVKNKTGGALVFKQTDAQLFIDWQQPLKYMETITFTVAFTATDPKNGLIFVPATTAHPAQINTYSWPEKAHFWFPCFDYPNDKITSEIIATVPAENKVLSNGRLVEVTKDEKSGTSTYHWSQEKPHPVYNIMLAVAPYTVIHDALGDLAVNYWVYPKDVANARRSFAKTPKMIDFYNTTFAFQYPWAKYDQVCYAGFGGGMETTSATMLGDGIIHDERAEQDFPSSGLVAHELAHQWWGDTITERSWSDVWLSESFATYAEYLFACYDQGADEGAYNLWQKKADYLAEARTRYMRPLVFNRYADPWMVMDGHSYPKGAAILHMLRCVMGDKPFFHALSYFLHKYAFQSVETHDLMNAIKDATGQNMDWFFAQWVYKPGHPVFDIHASWDAQAKTVTMQISQTQDTARGIPIYRLPVVIALTTVKGTSRTTVWLQNRQEEIRLPCVEKPLLIRFDEGNQLLKEVNFTRSLSEMLYQLKNDDCIGRGEAAENLAQYKNDPVVSVALLDCARHDPFWAVRCRAVAAFAACQHPGAVAIFKSLAADANAKVRTAALRALANTGAPHLVTFYKERCKKETSYVAQAEAIKAIGVCGTAAELDFLGKFIFQPAPRDILKRSAAAAIEAIKARAKQLPGVQQ